MHLEKRNFDFFLREIGLTILFYIISIALGTIQFQVPGIEGSFSDLREIPLLISIFYLKNPVSVIILCVLTAFNIPPETSFLSTFTMHLVGLIAGWLFYKKIKQTELSPIALGFAWSIFVFIYFCLLLIPILILIRIVINQQEVNFSKSYFSIMIALKFELIPSVLVSSLYLVQMEIRNDLEIIVTKRTQELSTANQDLQIINEELTASHEEVNVLNENLEMLVLERTKTINVQLLQMVKYAHLNAHEVRAPLARILGLLQIIKLEKEESKKEELLQLLSLSAKELDDVIKQMSRLLEMEVSTKLK